MTGTYCSSCGAERVPGASFCASCGAALTGPPPGQPAAPNAGHVAPQGPHAGPEYGGGQAQYPAGQPAQPMHPGQQPPPAPQANPGQQAQYPSQQAFYSGAAAQYPDQQGQYAAQPPPYANQQPHQPWAGNAPFGEQSAQPGALPWGVAPTAALQPTGTAGRSAVDALLTGDWGGAARTAASSVAAMLAVSLVGMLLLSQGDVGFRETMALVLAGACLAVGGDAYAEADAQSFGASFSMGLLPLTVTLVGLGLLGWLFAKQVRKPGPTSATEVLLHGVRTALVFTALFLPLSLLTRYQAEGAEAIGVVGRLGVGVVSSVLGALLFSVAVLGLTALLHRSTVLPGRWGALREKALASLFGAVAVFTVGLLAVVATLIYTLIEESGKLAQLGVAVLGAGNGALATVLWSAGVPMNVDGNASATPLGRFAPSGSDSLTLFTFTDGSAWFWLAPLLLLATMLLVATALAVRQNTIEDARREGFRFAGALALVGFVAALLLRIGVDGEASEFQTAADGSAMFNPIMAAFVLAIWGVLTGLLAPVVAAKVSSGFVTSVRRRFGAAVESTPPVY
jgi:hypothetical protein